MTGIAEQRLFSQQVATTRLKQPGDVVSWMGAIQAQDYGGAKWSIGLRLRKTTEQEVEQAISDAKILRTWAMRGTLHFVEPKDIRWMLELLAPRIIANNARRYKELELDERTFARGNDAIAKALQGGNQLDRPQLVAVLEKHGISAAGQRTPYLLQRAALERLICQGVMRGKNPTFFLLDELIPKPRPLTREEALAELALRYFTSRGPATIRDYTWWSELSPADANIGLDSVKSKLTQESTEGRVTWLSRSRKKAATTPITAYLLPGFDEYLLSYQDRSASMDVKRLRTLTPSNGMLPPTLVINGRVAGTWKRTLKKDRAVIALKPFTLLSAAEQRGAVTAAAHRYGDFLEMAVELKW